MAYAKKKSGRKQDTGNKSVALPNSNVVADDEHTKLIKWINEADDATFTSRELSAKCSRYYHSDQWTSAERSKLSAQKQAATVINRIKPKMDGLMGMESANRTTAKAQPRTPKHEGGAVAATEGVRFVLQDNFYNEKRSEAWENLTIEGTGGVEVIAEDMGEGKDIRLTINHIMWDRIIYDPHSRRKDFSDARYLGQVVWMDYDEAVAMYPDAVDVLGTMQSGSQTYEDKPRWMDNTRKRVKIVELYYYKSDGEVWYSCFTRGGWCKEPKISAYIDEEGNTEWPYEFASLFVTTEGVRYGAAFQYLDVQDEINKRRSKALHLMSVRQTFGTAGAVADVNKARAEMAKPDGHVEFAYGELNKDFGVLPTGDMAAAQFNLLTESKMEIDAVGYNAAASGKDTRAISGVALRQRTQASQTELAPMFNVLKNLDIRVYRKVWNRIKQYWKAEKWIRITDDENTLKFVGLNKPMTKGETLIKQAQEQMASKGMPPEQMQQAMAQMQQQIAMDPSMKEVVSTENDIANLDVDIIMDDAPDTVTQEVEDFQAMAEMVKSGFPIPPEAVIMSSPLSNKDKILKMMKEQPQLPPQVQEQMKKMQEEGQKLQQENQILKSDQQADMAKIQSEEKLKTDAANRMHELSISDANRSHELMMEKARLDAAAKIEVAQINAKTALSEAGIKAASDADVALSAEMKQPDGPDGQPVEALTPISKLSSLHEQGMAQHGASMDQLGSVLTQAFAQMGDALNQLVGLQQQTLAAIQSPKSVSIGGIQRGPDGAPIGATVNSRLLN